MRAVLGVEVLQIRNVLEVVGVDLAALHDVVRLDVVGELLDVEGDVLRGQDLLGDGEDLGVRGGRCGDGDGRAGEGVVVDGVVIAIARVLHDADDSAAIVLGDVVGDLLAGDGGLEGLDLVGLFVAFLHDEDVAVGRGGAFNEQGIGRRVQTGGDRVVGVDDGVVDVLQNVRDLRGLDLVEGDILRVLGDVIDGGGDAGAVFQLDVAVVLEQEQRAGFVRRVVRDGDGDAGGFAAAGGQRGEQENSHNEQCKNLFHDSQTFLCFDLFMMMYQKSGSIAATHSPAFQVRPDEGFVVQHGKPPQKNNRKAPMEPPGKTLLRAAARTVRRRSQENTSEWTRQSTCTCGACPSASS